MSTQTPMLPNHADWIIATLELIGVKRLFGMPGGGSNADLIEAARRAGLPFSLAHTEAASAFMATGQAEISGRPGACMATLGPGAASLVNGVANAHLDRVPLIALTDCCADQTGTLQHQRLSQQQIFAPVVKWSGRLSADNADQLLQQAVQAVCTLPPGPIHLDVSSQIASAPVQGKIEADLRSSKTQPEEDFTVSPEVGRILGATRRPLLLIGLGARTTEISRLIQDLCQQFGIPALVTYKAKGVVPDAHPWFAGVLTNGSLEREVLKRADLFLAIGLDPVELLPVPWRYPQPVISITSWDMNQQHIPVAFEMVGRVESWLQSVSAFLSPGNGWTSEELYSLVQNQRAGIRSASRSEKLLPHRVVELVADVYQGARATVDAGAFMFPVMTLWPAEKPSGVMISNGLSTMGFALPAAIGAALLEPTQPVVVFTGDGGLLISLGELRTAARESLPLRIVVFEDGELSLIKIKQLQRGFEPLGTSIGEIDWRSLGAGLGVWALSANNESELQRYLRETVNHPGPVLIAARIDAGIYPTTMRALRG